MKKKNMFLLVLSLVIVASMMLAAHAQRTRGVNDGMT